MRLRSRLNLLFGCGAILYAFLLLAACGVISWGSWQSGSPWFRFQTEALLRGSLALSHNPLDLTHDLCWSEGGVHQFWGLGIPLWQLPFAALAKLFGWSPFPDRIALGLFIALVAYIVLRTCFGPLLKGQPELTSAGPAGTSRCQWFIALGVVMICLFFSPGDQPHALSDAGLRRGMAYVYFFGIPLLCGIIELARNPQWWCFCSFVAWLASRFIRPTFVFYGLRPSQSRSSDGLRPAGTLGFHHQSRNLLARPFLIQDCCADYCYFSPAEDCFSSPITCVLEAAGNLVTG